MMKRFIFTVKPGFRLWMVVALFVIVMIWLFSLSVVADNEGGEESEERTKFHLGETKYNEGDLASAIKIFTEVAQIAEKKNDHNLACLSYFDLGTIYFYMHSTGEALRNYQKAYDICMHNRLGPIREAEIMGGIGGVYFELGSYVKARNVVRKALKLAESTRDSLLLHTLSTDMALIYNKTADFDSVAYWLERARIFSPSEEDGIKLLEIAAEAAMLQKDYRRAEELCNRILAHSNQEEATHGLAYTYLLRIAGTQARWDEIDFFEKKALEGMDVGFKPFYFDVASEVHAGKGDYRRALELKDSVVFYRDSLDKVDNRQLVENENIKFEVMKYQFEAERELARQKSRTLIWISMTVVSLCLLVISVMFWRNQQTRHRTQEQMLALKLEKEHKEKELAEEKVRETELIARHKQEMLQKEIERQNTQMQANAMFVSSRNQLIENLLKYIDNMKSEADMPEIRSLRKHLGRMLGNDSKDHEDFMMNVEAADPDLSRRLLATHPGLLQSDIKFLGYIKMNMSMKEIAAIMNVNPDSCKRRKIRISKKLGLKSSADLYAYLLKLSDSHDLQ